MAAKKKKPVEARDFEIEIIVKYFDGKKAREYFNQNGIPHASVAAAIGVSPQNLMNVFNSPTYSMENALAQKILNYILTHARQAGKAVKV